jgi:hypothetical protein
MGWKYFLTNIYILDNLSMEGHIEKELLDGRMALFIMVNGKIIKNKDRVDTMILKIILYPKDNTKIISQMDLE